MLMGGRGEKLKKGNRTNKGRNGIIAYERKEEGGSKRDGSRCG